MAGVGLATCAGGRAHQRRVLRPCSSVYVRRRPVEVRRRQSSVSVEVVFCLRARGASLSSKEASRGVKCGGGGLEWPVYGGWGSGGHWHPVHRANAGELVLGQGWERAGAYGRGWGWLYSRGCGRGHGVDAARRGARGAERRGVLWRCQGASNTWPCYSAQILAPSEHSNVRILPYDLCKISSLHLELSSSCEFQGEIGYGLEDMVAPSLVCLHCSSQEEGLDQEIRDLEIIHQQVQRKKKEKMAWLADLQKKIDKATEEVHHLTQDDHDRRPQHNELRQERSFNEDEWYGDFNHGSFTFDDASPLVAELQAIPWPQSYKPPQLPMYDGHSDPKQFLMSYEATISSYGGNTAVMAKSFVMAVRNVAQTWYSSLRPGTITSWQKLKDMLVTSF
jgi:hypothetical protein